MSFRLNFKDEEAKIEEKHSPSKVLWLLLAEMKKRVPWKRNNQFPYRNLDNSSVNTLSSRVVWYIPSSQWIGICRRKSWIFQNVKIFLNFRSSFCPVGLCQGMVSAQAQSWWDSSPDSTEKRSLHIKWYVIVKRTI